MKVLLVAQTQLAVDVDGSKTIEQTGYHLHPPEKCVRAADELAEAAGRGCYESWGRPNEATATSKGYLNHILEVGHFSILEHASVTFHLSGVSRNFTHELVRHRHLSYSELSQRYVNVASFAVVTPPDLIGMKEEMLFGDHKTGYGDTYDGLSIKESIRNAKDEAKVLYELLVDRLTKRGHDRKEARQAARYVVPSGLETKIWVTGNHRAFLEMLPKRMAEGADKEFQLVAREMLRQLKVVAPNTYQHLEVPTYDI